LNNSAKSFLDKHLMSGVDASAAGTASFACSVNKLLSALSSRSLSSFRTPSNFWNSAKLSMLRGCLAASEGASPVPPNHDETRAASTGSTDARPFCSCALEFPLEQRKINQINTGIYVIRGSILLSSIPVITDKQMSKKEYYLTDLFAEHKKNSNIPIRIYETCKYDDWVIQGVNTPEELEKAENRMKRSCI